MAKKTHNYLLFVPVRNEKFPFHDREGGLVTVTVVRTGFYNSVAQKIFKAPPTSEIDLDLFGSFVWRQIDGERSIYEIAQLVREEFGERAEPLYDRLVKYFRILQANRFIRYRKTPREAAAVGLIGER